MDLGPKNKVWDNHRGQCWDIRSDAENWGIPPPQSLELSRWQGNNIRAESDSKEDDSGREVIAVMVNVFGDDSADETKQRVFAVAGVIATDDVWDAVTQKWEERNKGVPFHATDCESGHGDYEGRDHNENHALYKDLSIMLAESGAWGFGAAVDMAGFREVYPDLHEEMAYYKAFFEVVYYLSNFAKTYFRDTVKFTLDNRIQSNYSAAAIYDMLVNDAAIMEEGPDMFDEISFASSVKQVRIQVGDLYAREVMKELDRRLAPKKRAKRKSMVTLESTHRFGADLLMRQYFADMRSKTAQLEANDKEFNRHTYAKWLKDHRLVDNIPNRFKFAAIVRSDDRSKKNNDRV